MTIPNPELHTIIRRAVSRRPDFLLDDALLLWQRLSVELVPIIGDGGFDSLYVRSLNVCSQKYAWILVKGIMQSKHASFLEFIAMLKDRDAAEATEAIASLLIIFTDILATLIGISLTTRILRSAWGDDSFDLPVPEQQ
ncbi:hypothetical protein AAKU67_003228 [Oxalobacteraceae bacterium GrIS 2.11]